MDTQTFHCEKCFVASPSQKFASTKGGDTYFGTVSSQGFSWARFAFPWCLTSSDSKQCDNSGQVFLNFFFGPKVCRTKSPRNLLEFHPEKCSEFCPEISSKFSRILRAEFPWKRTLNGEIVL